jgi:hypothetical protein
MLLKKIVGIVSVLLANDALSSELDVYGKLNASWSRTEAAVTDKAGLNSTSVRETDYKNHASRVGVKASVTAWEIGGRSVDKLYAVVEYGMNFDGGKTKTFPLRDAYIGIEQDIWSLVVGQMNTPTKLSQGRVDVFNDVIDMNALIAGERNGDMATLGLAAGDLSFNFAVVDDASVTRGGLGQGWSTSVKWQEGNTYAAVSGDHDISNTNTLRVLAGTRAGAWSWGALWQTSRLNEPGEKYQQAVLISTAYRVNSFTYKAQWIRSDMDNTVKGFYGIKGQRARLLALGVDYRLNASLALHIYSGYAENRHNDSHTLGIGGVYQF